MKKRGTKAEAHAKREKDCPRPSSSPISHPFEHDLHNVTFSLAARGSEERRTSAQRLFFV